MVVSLKAGLSRLGRESGLLAQRMPMDVDAVCNDTQALKNRRSSTTFAIYARKVVPEASKDRLGDRWGNAKGDVRKFTHILICNWSI